MYARHGRELTSESSRCKIPKMKVKALDKSNGAVARPGRDFNAEDAESAEAGRVIEGDNRSSQLNKPDFPHEDRQGSKVPS